MDCKNCKIKLLKHDRLCNQCKFDDGVTISKTNAKKIYKLSDDDLMMTDIYQFEFRTQHGYGVRYLKSELEKWIENDSNLSLKDKRYLALIKSRQDGVKKQNEQQIKINNKMIIKELLIDVINKLCQDDSMDEMKYVITNDFYIDLDDFITDKMNVVVVCNELVHIVGERAKSLRKVNDLLKKHYKRAYNKHIKLIDQCSIAYKKCMYDADRNQNIKVLIKELDQIMKVDLGIKRANKLEKLIKSENKQHCKDHLFYEFIRTDKRYKQYVDKNVLPNNATLDDLVQKINKSVKNKIEKNKRKTEIDNIISTFDEKYVSHLATHKIYKEYVNKNKGVLNEVIDFFIEEINNLYTIDNRKNILKQNIADQNIGFYESSNDSYVENYINGAVDLQTTLALLLAKYGLMRVGTNDIKIEIADMTKVIEEFDESNEKERVINNYYGEALTFLNKHCRLKGYRYKRLDTYHVSIKKGM